VSATDAAKNFGRLVDRVREQRATYVIERAGEPVAQIGPVAAPAFTVGELKALVSRLPPPGAEYQRAVERAVTRHNRPAPGGTHGSASRHERAHRRATRSGRFVELVRRRRARRHGGHFGLRAAARRHRLSSAVARTRAERFVEQVRAVAKALSDA